MRGRGRYFIFNSISAASSPALAQPLAAPCSYVAGREPCRVLAWGGGAAIVQRRQLHGQSGAPQPGSWRGGHTQAAGSWRLGGTRGGISASPAEFNPTPQDGADPNQTPPKGWGGCGQECAAGTGTGGVQLGQGVYGTAGSRGANARGALASPSAPLPHSSAWRSRKAGLPAGAPPDLRPAVGGGSALALPGQPSRQESGQRKQRCDESCLASAPWGRARSVGPPRVCLHRGLSKRGAGVGLAPSPLLTPGRLAQPQPHHR